MRDLGCYCKHIFCLFHCLSLSLFSVWMLRCDSTCIPRLLRCLALDLNDQLCLEESRVEDGLVDSFIFLLSEMGSIGFKLRVHRHCSLFGISTPFLMLATCLLFPIFGIMKHGSLIHLRSILANESKERSQKVWTMSRPLLLLVIDIWSVHGNDRTCRRPVLVIPENKIQKQWIY